MELQHHDPEHLTSVVPMKHEPSVVNDKEVASPAILPGEGDPFGDESYAQVRYRTMSWWQVTLVSFLSKLRCLVVLSRQAGMSKPASPSNSLLMPVSDSISNDCRDYITWNSVTAQSVVDAGSAAVRPDTVSSKQHMPVRLANGSSSEVFWLSWELGSSPHTQDTPSAN